MGVMISSQSSARPPRQRLLADIGVDDRQKCEYGQRWDQRHRQQRDERHRVGLGPGGRLEQAAFGALQREHRQLQTVMISSKKMMLGPTSCIA